MSSQIRNPQSEIRNSHWWLVTLTVRANVEETASSLLFDLGTSGILTLEEKPDTVKLGAYFDRSLDADEIKKAIESEFARAGHLDELLLLSVSAVEEQDWMQKWKEGFEAVRLGERLIVAPSWNQPDKGENQVVIQIDPGMAFGTGTHETTRLCLEAIERCWQGGALLDVGTGTGVLAIAAAKLRPGSRVVAIDVDPQAVDVARENVAINGLSGSVELSEAPLRNYAGQDFDVVVANLTAEVIIDLMEDLVRCLGSTGVMILSGILTELAADVERALGDSAFKLTERREAGEWCALIVRKAGR